MASEDFKNKEESLVAEQDELRLMIQEGVTFDVDVTYMKRKPGFLGFFRKRDKVTEKKVFRIKEPTLSTLDRLSALWLQMDLDEARMQEDDYLKAAKQMAGKQAGRLAEVVAVAVLGEDYYKTVETGGGFRRTEDKAALEKLKMFFMHTVKPSDLFTLAVLITNVSNLGDFINSIRLMSATRTSDPAHLIEPQD